MNANSAGVCIASELSYGPVSIKQTDSFSASDNLFASTQPADPPPTIT